MRRAVEVLDLRSSIGRSTTAWSWQSELGVGSIRHAQLINGASPPLACRRRLPRYACQFVSRGRKRPVVVVGTCIRRDGGRVVRGTRGRALAMRHRHRRPAGHKHNGVISVDTNPRWGSEAPCSQSLGN